MMGQGLRSSPWGNVKAILRATLGSRYMGLSVTFVSGPRRSGKSAVIRGMIDRLWQAEPHYLRLVSAGSDKLPPKIPAKRIPPCGVASARWLEYDADRIFEILPEALTAIYRRDRYGSVVVEADADPALRHAYPYDNRIFVMPVPASVETVFRQPHRAAAELELVLDDTAAFASEIFGLFQQDGQEEVDPSEDRPELTGTQMRGFLNSPLGSELATRIQLQQPYHGLVESDVIVVNTSAETVGAETSECLRRIEHLLQSVRGPSGRQAAMFLCNPRDQSGRDCKKLLKALKPMCQGGK